MYPHMTNHDFALIFQKIHDIAFPPKEDGDWSYEQAIEEAVQTRLLNFIGDKYPYVPVDLIAEQLRIAKNTKM